MDSYAIIMVGGKQYRVREGDKLLVDRLSADEGKTFHVPNCPYLHGKRRVLTAQEAVREGYVPCVRCERALLGR